MNLFDLCAAFFGWIGKCVKWCWNLLLDSIRLSLQKWYIVMPVVVVFFIVGLLLAHPSRRVYKVEAQLWLNGPQAFEVNEAVKPLGNLLPGEMYAGQTLEQLLQLPPEQVFGVEGVETFPVIDFLRDSTADAVDYKRKHKLTDTLNVVMKQCVQLRFRTRRPQNAAVVGQAVLDYLNRNPTFQSAYEGKMNVLRQQNDFYTKQVAKADSIADAFYLETGKDAVQIQSRSNNLLMGKREVESFYPQLQAMLNEAKKTQHEIALATAPVVAPQGFVINRNAVNRYSNCGIIALLLGYIIGCLVAYAVKRREDLKAWLKKK